MGENTIDMYNFFPNMVNDSLKKRFEISELVKKVLRSLLDLWSIKVIVVEESTNLSKIGMDELMVQYP